jgi:hypothetical protein
MHARGTKIKLKTACEERAYESHVSSTKAEVNSLGSTFDSTHAAKHSPAIFPSTVSQITNLRERHDRFLES